MYNYIGRAASVTTLSETSGIDMQIGEVLCCVPVYLGQTYVVDSRPQMQMAVTLKIERSLLLKMKVVFNLLPMPITQPQPDQRKLDCSDIDRSRSRLGYIIGT